MKFAEVAVDSASEPGRTFSYAIPALVDLQTGHVVRVPFGRQIVQGVVFGLTSSPAVPITKDILGVIDSIPALTEVNLRLARWLSSYYQCALYEAAALMLPPGGRLRRRAYYSVNHLDSAVNQNLTCYQHKVLTHIINNGNASTEQMTRIYGDRVVGAINKLIDLGIVTRSYSWAGAKISHKKRYFVRISDTAQLSPDSLPVLSEKAKNQISLLKYILEIGSPVLLSELRKTYGHAVDALLKKGWLERDLEIVDRDPIAGNIFPEIVRNVLTEGQTVAANCIRNALDDLSASSRTFVLEGVTGSGKTEVYLDAVEKCIALGRRAIVMVPEISLTRQTVERFVSRFPDQVAILHSGLSPGERFDQWWKIRQGDYQVVVGSRSSIFAPIQNLGLVVIDEEHEWTYKEHRLDPRYHSREVACVLGGFTGAVVLLGSATPDVVSYSRSLTGEFELLRLPDRVRPMGSMVGSLGSLLPDVQIVDMRQQLKTGNSSVFSRPLQNALAHCFDAGNQAILFLNRRGASSYVQCLDCGLTFGCRRCDIAMTYHGENSRLICHHCGYRRNPPDKCPECRNNRIRYRGIGTQSVVTEFRRLYPKIKILRWDRDSANKPTDHENLLEQFRSGQMQVLVGTQMIAKGFHFPSVTLVGVVLADVGIYVPDYRAGERAFQLLCQVSGRAGRGKSQGYVVIQTFQPDNYAVQAAAQQDYRSFFDQELIRREEQKNPPFNKLIKLHYAHTNQTVCEQEAFRLSENLRRQRDSWGYSDVEVLGPVPSYPPKMRGRYRWNIHLRGTNPRVLLEAIPLPRGWFVDVDPVGLE